MGGHVAFERHAAREFSRTKWTLQQIIAGDSLLSPMAFHVVFLLAFRAKLLAAFAAFECTRTGRVCSTTMLN